VTASGRTTKSPSESYDYGVMLWIFLGAEFAGYRSLLRPHDQRVVVDAASHSQAGYLIFDTNYLHLAPKLDIAVTLVEVLPRYCKNALETVAQVDGALDQTIESSAAQILSFPLDGL
jgi:hypothetical protein